MTDSVIHILTLSSVLVFSPYLSKLFRLPPTPIEIIIGSLLAYQGIIRIEEVNFKLLSDIGFLYLMFLAGLEVNLKSILKMPRIYIVQSFYFIVVLWIFATIAVFIFNLHAIFIGILPLVSIGLLATLSKQYGKELRWIKMAFLVGTIGEVVSITALTLLEASSSVGLNQHLINHLFLLIVFLSAVYALYLLFRLLFWWFPEFKTTLMPRDEQSYQDLRLAMGLFFIMIAIMKIIHLELAFGAFIAGLFISTFFHHKKALEEKMSSFGFGFLVPIFFIYVGASFNINHIINTGVLLIAAKLLITMFGIRILAGYTLSFLIGKRNAILVSFALSMPLTLMIAVATVALHNHSIGQFDYYAIILASLIEVLLAIIGIKIISRK